MTSETTAACCPNCGANLTDHWRFDGSQTGPRGHRRGERPRYKHGRILMPGGGRASKWWKVSRGIKKLPYCVHPAHVSARIRDRIARERRDNHRSAS